MTAPDQAEEADRAAHHIDRLLAPYVPDVSRWDLALRIVADMQAEEWRCIRRPPNVITATRDGTPPNDDWLAAKAAITRKEDDA
jgi:hypothetical protein